MRDFWMPWLYMYHLKNMTYFQCSHVSNEWVIHSTGNLFKWISIQENQWVNEKVYLWDDGMKIMMELFREYLRKRQSPWPQSGEDLFSLLDPPSSACQSAFCCWLLEINRMPERKLTKWTNLSWATDSFRVWALLLECSQWYLASYQVRSPKDVLEAPCVMPACWSWLARGFSHLEIY